MLGNLKLIVDTHCEIYRDLRPWTDDIFWDLTQHNFVPGAVYVIGRQQFRTHYAQIKTAVEQKKIKAIFSNPHEGSETIRWQLVAYGIDDLVRAGHILVISGGDIEPGFVHYQHENFISKCFAYTENNVYSSSKTHNDLYCLGSLRNSLLLQKSSYDRISQITSATSYNTFPASPESVVLIDGATYTGAEFTGVVPSGNNSGIVNKPGELIQIDDNNLIAFYNLSGDLNNFYYRLIEFGIASARLTLINKSSISTNKIGRAHV